MNARPLLLALACGLAVPLASCAHAPRDATPGAIRAAASIEEPRRRLSALAEIEAVRVSVPDPGFAAMARLIDPTLPETLAPGSAEFRRSVRPLSEVLDESRIRPPMSEIETPTREATERAAKAYAEARSARLSGEPDRARVLMEEAVELDPGSAKLWQELGEARLALDDRFGAADALTMAAELGSTDPRVPLTLASEAASRGDAEGVVRWSAAAWGMDAAESGSVERIVAGSLLGTALIESDELLAGAEALEATLKSLDTVAPSAGEAAELARLRARRAELGFRLGDAWIALGRPERAARAYELARAGHARVPVLLVQRLVAAQAAAGRPATAALTALAHAEERLGDLGREEAGWLHGLSRDPRVGPALTDAILALAADPDRPLTGRRQALGIVVRASADPNGGVRAMGIDPVLARSTLVTGEALLKIVPEQRITLAAEWTGKDPAAARAWAGALVRLTAAPLETASELIASRDRGRRTVGLAMAAELDRPDLAGGVIDAGPDGTIDPLLGAYLAGTGGRWAVADAWLAGARAAADADPTRRPELLAALLACQRLEEVDALARAIDADPAASADDLFIAGEYALLTEDAELGLARLDRAARVDPFDERVWERRIALRTGESPLADEEQARALGRAISEVRSRGALFAVLRARDVAGQGMIREACETIIAANEREPARDAGLTLLAQGVQAAIEHDDAETAAMVRDWLDRRAERFPGSVAGAVARAQAMLVAGESAEAFEVLDDAWARTGHPETARMAEAVLVRHLDRRDEAYARALDRLDAPFGVNGSLERAETAAGVGRWPVVAESALAAIPPAGRLSPPQRARWYRLALGVAQAAENPDAVPPALRILDAASRIGPDTPVELLRARLVLLARGGDADELRSFVEREELGPNTGLTAVQALLGADRVADALTLLGDLALSEKGVWEDEFAEWARLTGAVGAAADVRAMVERLDALGHTADAARVVSERFAPGTVPGERTAARDRADIAYAAALIATVFDRDAEAEAMYRLALEYDPAHAWSLNDLGYALTERGESLDEAERCLTEAYRLLPDEASVADSLGWLRYVTGVLLDETDPAGAVVRDGAITLLRRAASLEGGDENATVHEHLGDALWRAGRTEDAVRAWAEAETLLRAQARRLATEGRSGGRGVERINEQLRSIRRRLSEAENGARPPVAPSPALDGAETAEPADDPAPEPPDPGW